MIISQEVENMCPVAQGVHHGAAPVPTEGKWVKNKDVKDISGLTHGVGWCAPQQGACKLTLNVKEGIIQEALVETIGCSGMTHSAAMASEILPGLTVMEALNTDLVCDAINTAMRELFLQIVYGRTQSAFSEEGLPVGAGLEDLGKGLRSQVGTMYGTLKKGPRYLEMAEGYVTVTPDNVIDYDFVKADILRIVADYDLRTSAYDRWNSSQTIIDLQNEGMECNPFGQGYGSMSAPTKEFEKLVLTGKIEHFDNPVLRWMLASTLVKTDPAGNIKPDKEKSTQKIDGIVAAIMALGEWMTAQANDESNPYENRGLLTL